MLGQEFPCAAVSSVCSSQVARFFHENSVVAYTVYARARVCTRAAQLPALAAARLQYVKNTFAAQVAIGFLRLERGLFCARRER